MPLQAAYYLLDISFGKEYVWLFWVFLVTNFSNLSKHLEAAQIYLDFERYVR